MHRFLTAFCLVSVCYVAGFLLKPVWTRLRGDDALGPLLRRARVVEEKFRNASKGGAAVAEAEPRSVESDRARLLEWLRTSNVSSVGGTHRLGGALIRNEAPHSSLLYIYVPKAGSTTVKTVLNKVNRTSGGRMIYKDAAFLDAGAGVVHIGDARVGSLGMSSFHTFSLLRDPRERIMSAYSTTMKYPEGLIGTCRGGTVKLISPPKPQTKESGQWKSHFVSSMEHWVENIREYGWGGPSHSRCEWNCHIVPQAEFLKGYDVRHIGCLEAIDDTLKLVNLTGFDANSGSGDGGALRNHYEHDETFMPDEKFQSYDLLPTRTKARIEELYREDFELYHAFCGGVARSNATWDVTSRCSTELRSSNGSRCYGFNQDDQLKS